MPKEFCKYQKKCGGCQLTNLSYQKQLQHKQVQAIKTLGKFGHVEEIIGMENPLHYRTKVQAAFSQFGGKTVAGVYQSSTHKIVDTDCCMIEDELADKIILEIKHMMKGFKLAGFNEDTGRGNIRHVLVRRSPTTGQTLVAIVTPSSLFPKGRQFANELSRRFPEISTIVQNVNPRRTSMVLGNEEIVLFGDGYIEDELLGRRFRLSASSFYQVNHVQTEVLYSKAIEFANLTKDETLIDAYCGVGTLGILAAPFCKNVLGVELNAAAVKDAKVNARLNNLSNINFICADAGKLMKSMAQENQSVNAVIMDPPRAGASLDFLKSIAALKPQKVVYISCNIETQARDLLFLRKNGYKVKKIQPVDMFPYTNHTESVVKLEKRG